MTEEFTISDIELWMERYELSTSENEKLALIANLLRGHEKELRHKLAQQREDILSELVAGGVITTVDAEGQEHYYSVAEVTKEAQCLTNH